MGVERAEPHQPIRGPAGDIGYVTSAMMAPGYFFRSVSLLLRLLAMMIMA